MSNNLSMKCTPNYEPGVALVDGVFTPEHEAFRSTFRRFIEKEITPYYKEWEKAENGYPKELWKLGASAGFAGSMVPEEYGGPGGDILYTLIMGEELGRTVAGASIGSYLTTDLMTATLIEYGSEEQKKTYCPQIVAGERSWALGLTEPDAGSDIMSMRSRARKDGDDYLISGQKCFISSGMSANTFLYLAKTDEDLERGPSSITMFLLDDPNAKGFSRQRMSTLGERAGTVAELFLDEVRVHKSAIVGEPGMGLKTNLGTLMPFDRTMIATRAHAISHLAFDLTVDYVKNRKLFGQTVFDFQNTKFKLADMKANLVVGDAFRLDILKKLVANELDMQTTSISKLWFTENEYKTVSECYQLHGGYAYMTESPISTLFTFARLETIYAGTSEIQKHTIAKFI
jgi:alkylation response protein AidB-like acyl-CoA dehydrogenase